MHHGKSLIKSKEEVYPWPLGRASQMGVCVMESGFTTQLVLCSWQQGVSQEKIKYFKESSAAIITRKMISSIRVSMGEKE